jgi:hypothetical protein
MRKRVRAASILAGLATAALLAQEGHPMVGTWHGDWGPSATQRTPAVWFLKWDTKNIVGTINPGPNAMPVKTATLDPSNWALHMEADGKDQAGNPVHVVIDGKIENIGSYNRTVSGTWLQGSAKGNFKMTRD